jgi:glycosyltransferase involved in cell wall biosynthesis
MTIGMIRVKDEARWISRVVRSIAPLCERVFVFDDHSADETARICRFEGCSVIPSPFSDFNESRDMQHLYEHVSKCNPDWVISIDGDEELDRRDEDVVRRALASAAPSVSFFTLRILYLWDTPGQRRVDGVYGDFRRKRIFRPAPGACFKGGLHGGGAGHVSGLAGKIIPLEARLLHYGYLHKEDRLRKYNWHQQVDPGNEVEDGYRHIVQGDVPEVPADAKLKHAGPLRLEAIA